MPLVADAQTYVKNNKKNNDDNEDDDRSSEEKETTTTKVGEGITRRHGAGIYQA